MNKLKPSGITNLVFIILCAAVILAALGIGLCIREIMSQRAASEAAKAPAQKEQTSRYGSRTKGPALSPEERAKIKEQRERVVETAANMSEENKEKFRDQVREKFTPRQEQGRSQLPDVSPEEMADLRQKWENMSEEERNEFRTRLREKFVPRQQDAGQAPNDVTPGEESEPPENIMPEESASEESPPKQESPPQDTNSM